MFKQFKFIFFLTFLFVSLSFASSETWKYNYLPVESPTETSTTYFPTSIEAAVGTLTSSNVTYISYSYDDLVINFSETTGSPAMDYRINFTGVNSFNTLLVREQYIGNHYVQIQLWNYANLVWDTHYSIVEQSEMGGTIPIFIEDASNHIQNGTVEVRFYHTSNGNINDKLILDMVTLLKGSTTITTAEHDDLSGRNSPSNHPWAISRNGDTMMGKLILASSYPNNEGVLNIPNIGTTAPSSPVIGDVWQRSNLLYYRDGGGTIRQIAHTSSNVASSTYTTYTLGGRTKSDNNNNTGLWSYWGNVQFSYSGSYLGGHSHHSTTTFLEQSRNKSTADLESFEVDLSITLDSFTGTAEFNSNVPNIKVVVKGNTSLTEEDFSCLTYSSSTSSKVIRCYIKLKDEDTHYSIFNIEKYGNRYTTTGTRTTDTGFTYANEQTPIESLPTPVLGSIINAVKETENDPLSHHKGENINLTDNKNISLGLDSFIIWGPLSFVRFYELFTLIQGYDVKLVASNGLDYTGLVLTINRLEKDEFTNFLYLGSPFNPFDGLFVKMINTTNISSENAYAKNLTTDNLRITGEKITVGNVNVGGAINTTGSDFNAYGYSFEFLVYAYKDTANGKVYSVTPKTLSFSDDYSGSPYSINLSWVEVDGSDGYYILVNSDDYNYFMGDAYWYNVGGNNTSAIYSSGVPLVTFDYVDVSQKEFIPQNTISGGMINATAFAGDGSRLTGIKSKAILCAEESSDLYSNNDGTGGGLIFSWGNGLTANKGPRMMFSGRVLAMSMQVNRSATTGAWVEMAINGTAQGANYRLESPGVPQSGSHEVFTTPLEFNAGDQLTFSCTKTGSSTGGVVMCMTLEFDS